MPKYIFEITTETFLTPDDLTTIGDLFLTYGLKYDMLAMYDEKKETKASDKTTSAPGKRSTQE